MAAILITGAARGIGLELTRQLAARGDRVVALCRTASAELSAIEGIRIIHDLDVTDAAAVERLAAQLAHQALDVLLHNAGVLEVDTLTDVTDDSIRRQFEINALAPLRLTRALLPNLRSGSKVALISSLMGSVEDNGSGGMYGYRMSKAALNMAGKSLAVDLRDAGIAVGLYHPGLVATAMTGHQGIPPAEAAAGLIARIDALSLADSGQFLRATGEPLPW